MCETLKKLRHSGLDFSVATLNFLANIGVVLPYVLILFKYQQTRSSHYLVAIIVLYVARAASIFWTKHLNLTASNYLLVCLWLGAIGSIILSLTSNLVMLVIAAIALGYTSANLWPYYLTIKLHLTEATDFKLKKLYWLIFLGLALLFGLDFLFDLQYHLAFILLAALFLIAIPAGQLLSKFSLAFYDQHERSTTQPVKVWRVALFIIFFAVLGLLTLLRKVNLNIALPAVLALIVLDILLLNLEFWADWHAMNSNKLRVVNRGFLLSLVLLFNSFFGYFIFGAAGMYIVFGLYLLGFETGAPLSTLIANHTRFSAMTISRVGLVIGHLLILIPIPVIYGLGLLLVALYLGFENPGINDSVYHGEGEDPDLAIIHKYRFSMYGGLLCQLCFFGLLVIVSVLNNVRLMAFFNPTSPALAGHYLHGIAWPLVVVSAILTLISFYTQDHPLQKS